jgi:hypothetical protein
MDASLVIAHSDKQLAAGTYKGSFGHHPLEAWCDNTGESLALLLRTGSAGSNTAADHIEVLGKAITQIPARYRRDLLVTVDGAGASHGLVEHISTPNARPGYRVHYSIGWELCARERTALARVPACAWAAVLDAEGQPRNPGEAGVVELAALLREGPHGDKLASWPADMRIIARHENPTPARSSHCSKPPTGGATSSWPPTPPARAPSSPEARHRPHARVEDSRLHRQEHWPGPSALDLNRDQQGLVPRRDHRLRFTVLATPALPRGTLAKAEPKTLRYRLLHTPYPHRPRPTQTQDPHPRDLALGPATGHLPAHRPHPSLTHPRLITKPPSPTRETIRNRGIRRPPDATAGPTA